MPHRFSTSGLIQVCLALPLSGLLATAALAACDDAQTTREMRICAGQDFDLADAELNRAYKAARQSMHDLDRDLPDTLRGAEDALLQAQRAWIPFRDAACIAEGFQFRGGSFEPLMVTICKAELTRQRRDQLRSMIEVN
ncbi:hypothetical protein PH5382_02841 [Phaeobacter sp. CECT 5382]|uniref:lysozyme inhibitor LprI family protein n=1 Tax=Phaeobacter sp. CECT 5382 TaxID=1712645 RepID=UPI0006DA13EA|nr:lysozyme inhibitor LprI family protein [Phaeobacter sp. CECT 5382]CUH88897.1 hypothetical protein PH5382_02841 [Phaeobacter sp. CECT 5382]